MVGVRDLLEAGGLDTLLVEKDKDHWTLMIEPAITYKPRLVEVNPGPSWQAEPKVYE